MIAYRRLSALGAALLLCGAAARAQTQADGLIIRVEGRLAYIDAGARSHVVAGDLFDIVADEVVSHPLTGDTLAITARVVGALKVRQVFEKVSLVELLHLEEGYDPMLMKVVRVSDAERLGEIEHYLQRRTSFAAAGGVSIATALIPGFYQIRTGHRHKGWALLGLQVASLATAIGFRTSSNDFLDTYRAFTPSNSPPSSSEQAFLDRTFSTASNRRDWSNRFFWLAGAVYAYNWFDVLWPRHSGALGAAAPGRFEMGLSAGAGGDPLLRLSRSF